MPQLPTINITDQATFDRVNAAFGGSAANYKSWLKEELLIKVRQFEAAAAADKAVTDLGGGITNAT